MCALTRIRQRDPLGRLIAGPAPHWRNDHERDGAHAAQEDGVEDGGFLVGRPFQVADGGGPEGFGDAGGHAECCWEFVEGECGIVTK